MPQGTVIAVKPAGFISGPELRSASLTETASYSTQSIGGAGLEEESRLYYIGKYRGEGVFHGPIESVLWYEGPEGEFVEGDKVKFKIDNDDLRSIKVNAAKDVSKIGGILPFLSGDVLYKVALLASALILLAVTYDRKS